MNKNRLLFVLCILAVLCIVGCSNKDDNENEKNTSVEFNFDFKDKISIGNTEAKHTMVIFLDFECDACNEFNDVLMSDIKEKYINTNQLKIYYYQLPFINNTSAIKAQLSIMVEKQHPELYALLVEKMFYMTTEQNREMIDVKFTQKLVKEWFPNYELDKDVGMAFEGQEFIIKELESNFDIAHKLGIEQTPSVIVNNELMDNPFDLIELNMRLSE